VSRDLTTLTFDLGGHGIVADAGLHAPSVCLPSLNFVGLPVQKILGIYCVNIIHLVTLTFDLLSFDL